MYGVPASAVGLYRLPVCEYEGPPAVGIYGVPTPAVGMYGVLAVACESPSRVGEYGTLAVEGGESVVLSCLAIEMLLSKR
jgi:hypothetical protein